MLNDGKLLINYLRSRHSPVEQNEIMEKKQQIKMNIEKNCMYTTYFSCTILLSNEMESS